MKEIEEFFDRLWPLCRSLTGPGYRRSLDILSELIPTDRLRFATGTQALDWTVPKEWVAREAFFTDGSGRKYADFQANNLHLLNYSAPFQGELSLEDLRAHLYSLPDQPDAIPYRTSYYQERWGFCLTHRDLESLKPGRYRVNIDTELRPGHLEIGEAVLPGESPREVLFSSYLCHPSMANNELSGPLVLAFLYRKIRQMPKRRYSYRFALMPETIGAICYLSKRGEHLQSNLTAGYQITCVGDPGPFTYKKSRRGDSPADSAAAAVLRAGNYPHTIIDFDPSTGSDERQYCSPGFDLPVGSLMRTMYGRFPEYHTSLDDKNFIRFQALEESIEVYFQIVRTLESNRIWTNTSSRGEPQMGRRGLYPTLGAVPAGRQAQTGGVEALAARMWLLNLADGTRDLLAIADRSGQPVDRLLEAARELSAAGLLRE